MKFLPLLLMLSLAMAGNGQISGRITTTAGNPVPFASVTLLHSPDSSLAGGTTTDAHGAYRFIPSQTGSYLLKISSLGFQSSYSTVSVRALHTPLDLGLQVLLEDTRQLKELTVRTARFAYTQTPEGILIQVDKSLLAKGNSILSLLQQSPGVSIDYRNNSLALNGKSGVSVMLNGKMLRLPPDQVVAMLNGMNANNVVRLELLTAPGASHDAEGAAGIIHIVTRTDDALGTSAAVTLTGGYGWAEKATATVNLSHQTRTIRWFASYSFFRDRTYSRIGIDSRQDMPFFGGPLRVLVQNSTEARQTNHDASLNTEWHVSSRTTLRGQLGLTSNSRLSTDWNAASYHLIRDSVLYFNGLIDGGNHWQSTTAAVDFDTRFRGGATLHAGVDRIYFDSDSPSEVRNRFQNSSGEAVGSEDSLLAARQRGYARTAIRVSVGKVDYIRPLSAGWTTEAGLKGTFTQNQSRAGIQSLLNGRWADRSETTGQLHMREGIGAGYISLKGSLNDRLRLVAGVRLEYARTRLTDPLTEAVIVDRKQAILFPNLSLTKRMTDQSELSVSFSKRISRPTYQDLASFIRYSDPSAVYTGNPLLKPGVTSNLKLAYSHNGLVVSLMLSRDDHPIIRYQLTEGPLRNLLYVGPQNLAWQKNALLQMTLPYKPTDWWTMSYDVSGGWRIFRTEHTLTPVEKAYPTYSLNTTQVFKMPGRFSAEVSGWLTSLSYNGTIRVGPMGGVNAGIRKELKNGQIQVTVTDLFRSLHIDSYYGTVTREAFSIENHVGIDTESRVFPIVKLTWSRTFGRAGTAKRTEAEGSKEEKSRLISQ